MDRMVEAFAAAQRMIDELANNGFDRETLVNDFENDCDLPWGMWWNCGASRIVIGDELENYVLKIASTQNYEKYNQREVEVYQRAVEEGLEILAKELESDVNVFGSASFDEDIYVDNFEGLLKHHQYK